MVPETRTVGVKEATTSPPMPGRGSRSSKVGGMVGDAGAATRMFAVHASPGTEENENGEVELVPKTVMATFPRDGRTAFAGSISSEVPESVTASAPRRSPPSRPWKVMTSWIPKLSRVPLMEKSGAPPGGFELKTTVASEKFGRSGISTDSMMARPARLGSGFVVPPTIPSCISGMLTTSGLSLVRPYPKSKLPTATNPPLRRAWV